MELVFLIYGLAFFLLGFAILYYPKKNSGFHLARNIHYVGWFGVIHGINEWLDLLILIDALNASVAWKYLRMITLPLSFLLLLYFGSSVISVRKKNCSICKFLPWVLMFTWGILFMAGEHSHQRWDILSRYILCFPGALLTGLGLLTYTSETEVGSHFRLTASLKTAGIAFMVYAFFAGLIVKDAPFFPASMLNYSLFRETLGVPVQVFRSVCAVVIAYNLIRVLEIFHFEMQRSLEYSEMRFRTVVNTAPITLFIEDGNHRIMFLEGNGFAGIDIVSTDSIGKPTSEAFVALPQIYENTQRASSTGEDITEIITFQDHYYEFFAVPLKAGTDSIAGVIGIVIDVTRQKNAQNELDRYRVELEKNKVLATIGALSTEITAEIANPLHESKLSLLKAFSGLRKTIGAGDVKASIQEGLDKISQAIKTLDGFCEKANLQKSPHSEPIDLHELLRRVLAVTKESAEHAMVRITTAGADIFPAMRISSRELEQVLYNMVQKVIHSTDGGYVSNLEINFTIQDKCLCMKFSETSLKSPLDRVNETISNGTEIRMLESEYDFGLSVLKGIVEAYRGTITIARNSDDSVLYEIQLPLAG